MTRLRAGLLALLGAVAAAAAADDVRPAVPVERQSREDAWWTGPLLAPSAATLPRGHFLVEPYLFDSIVDVRYKSDGVRRGVPREQALGSLAFVLYGITDRLTAGVLPRVGYRLVGGGPSSSGVGVGDFAVQGQYLIHPFDEGRHVPAISLVAAETLPTGKYDRLGHRPANALGGGAYATSLSAYSQYFLWMPNGRILRTRLDLSYSLSGSARLRDASVYATPDGFRGRAHPGDAFLADASWEYSATRNWVLALDVAYEHDGTTRVRGTTPRAGSGGPPRADFRASLGSSESLALAPAIEYNWSGKAGVIVGAKLVPAGRNTGASVTPVAAINLVY